MRILYLFPTRERKEKCFKAIDNIISLSRHDDYLIQLVLDIDDSTMNTPKVRDRINFYGEKVKAYWGFSKNKIDAINRDISLCPEYDILCLHSDDMIFVKEGFDLDIIEGFADGFNGLLHFPDKRFLSSLITYSIMHRDYLKIDGYIYHPDFVSMFCDNLQQDIAKKRGKYKFVDKQILEHHHAIWGLCEKDALLNKTWNPTIYYKDSLTYDKLKEQFGL